MSLPRFQFTGDDGKQVAGEVLWHDARTLRLRVDTVAGQAPAEAVRGTWPR